MYVPLSDDKHQIVRDNSKKKHTGQCGRNSNPVATLPHAAVVFRMQPLIINTHRSTMNATLVYYALVVTVTWFPLLQTDKFPRLFQYFHSFPVFLKLFFT